MMRWSTSFTVDLQISGVTDPIFYDHLVNHHDLNGDGFFSPDEAAQITHLDISGLGIEDLAGLEQFTALTWLDASHNNIRSIEPINNNTNFSNGDCTKYLDLSHNDLDPNEPYCGLNCVGFQFIDISFQEQAPHLICVCDMQCPEIQ